MPSLSTIIIIIDNSFVFVIRVDSGSNDASCNSNLKNEIFCDEIWFWIRPEYYSYIYFFFAPVVDDGFPNLHVPSNAFADNTCVKYYVYIVFEITTYW